MNLAGYRLISKKAPSRSLFNEMGLQPFINKRLQLHF